MTKALHSQNLTSQIIFATTAIGHASN